MNAIDANQQSTTEANSHLNRNEHRERHGGGLNLAGNEILARARGEVIDSAIAVGVEEVEDLAHLLGPGGHLLVGRRRGDDVDVVARDAPDEEVAAGLERNVGELLRLAVDLAAMGDADLGTEKKVW